MTQKADGKSSAVVGSGSQLIVEDPQKFVELVKQRLHEKEGIPVEQQRLVFSVPHPCGVTGPSQVAQHAVEEVLGELGNWQAIVYQNDKPLGRLLAPELSSSATSLESYALDSALLQEGLPVENICLKYEQWEPFWLTGSSPGVTAKPLYVAVDDAFSAASFRIKVYGRLGGRAFAVPFTYAFSGFCAKNQLSLELQRLQYIRRHQSQRGAVLPASEEADIVIQCGTGVQGFSIAFDATDEPSWLKSIVLRFVIVAKSFFDDALRRSRLEAAASPPAKRRGILQTAQPARAPHQQRSPGEEWLPKGLTQRGGRQAGKIKRFSKQQKRSRAEAHLLQASAAPIPGDEQPGPVVDEEPVMGEAAGPQDTRACAQAGSSSRGLDQQQPMVTCVAGGGTSQPGWTGAGGGSGDGDGSSSDEEDGGGDEAPRGGRGGGSGQGGDDDDHTRRWQGAQAGESEGSEAEEETSEEAESLKTAESGMPEAAERSDSEPLGATRDAAKGVEQDSSAVDSLMFGSMGSAGSGSSEDALEPRLLTPAVPNGRVFVGRKVCGELGSMLSPRLDESVPQMPPAANGHLAGQAWWSDAAQAPNFVSPFSSMEAESPFLPGSIPAGPWSTPSSLDPRQENGLEAAPSGSAGPTGAEPPELEEAGPGSPDEAMLRRRSKAFQSASIDWTPHSGPLPWGFTRNSPHQDAPAELHQLVNGTVPALESRASMPHLSGHGPASSDGSDPPSPVKGLENGIARLPLPVLPYPLLYGALAEEADMQRQTSIQVAPPAQEAVFEAGGAPRNDLEQLLACITPVLSPPVSPSISLTLADVWGFFSDASLYGMEVYTISGTRGPAMAYYVPMLSALRLLLPVDAPAPGEEPGHRLYSCPEGPSEARLARPLLEQFEAEPPFLRPPLAERVTQLGLPTCADGRPGASLPTVALEDLHPCSWLAVAWYPVYRIPDAPLSAKFLTYHALTPTAPRDTHFGVATSRGLGSAPAAAAAGSRLCLPIIALKMADVRGERWLASTFESVLDAQSHFQQWQLRLRVLEEEAERLTRGQTLLLHRGGRLERPTAFHSDFEWFNRH